MKFERGSAVCTGGVDVGLKVASVVEHIVVDAYVVDAGAAQDSVDKVGCSRVKTVCPG